eukprot:GFKZ01000209.1.p1 GENE.GFKZ01000209.1~~GFKZ01000209.1.p1  ORF type:complete len:387 (-),score=73.96 GFKZ01000209.1:479-1639(-)
MVAPLDEPVAAFVSRETPQVAMESNISPKTRPFNTTQSDPASSPETPAAKGLVSPPPASYSPHSALNAKSSLPHPVRSDSAHSLPNSTLGEHTAPSTPDNLTNISTSQCSTENAGETSMPVSSDARADPPVKTAPVHSASNSQKKKKKRKSNSSSRDLDESQPLPNEESIRGDGVDQWRARAVNRRALLAKAKSDYSLLRADLAAALARVADAEQAEKMVNSGLVTARSVIAQRDRAIADLTSVHQQLKGEHAKIAEEKKRAEKKLLILKTVSANLQEAREGKEHTEKKLEEASGANKKLLKQIRDLAVVETELRNDVSELSRQVEALNMLKQKLARAEMELEELRTEKEELRKAAKRGSICAAGIGAAGAFALSFTLRLLRKERD